MDGQLALAIRHSAKLRTVKMGGRIYTIYTSNDMVSPNDVSFGGINDKNIVQSIKTP